MTIEQLTDPRQAALLVVDMQNDFCHANGGLAGRGEDISMIQAMAPRLVKFLQAARSARLPIIHIRTHHSRWTNSSVWLARHGDRANIPFCLPDSWGAEFYAGFEPAGNPDWESEGHEYVVTKHRYSAFIETDLDLVLRARGIRTLLMTGEATNVCVESTARDGYMKDYAIAFLSDCTASTSVSGHEGALENIRKHFGSVCTSEEVVRAWQATGALREPVSA